ncbi:hypothetical protein P22_1918 [Propionispora sp. 2/2-37]|uniref:hypothetical protein n=1 Tax=Propionispora sp. 2/2-37 TaxID=1677858 RepID=UPI0006BB778C|nr:hypothetical protein [Propionispora sp. 2/2-37]CUH95833.1 hypothetical protein P22_1918 [Propionispora sp. 2/2-37]
MTFGLLSINSMMKSYSRSRYSGSHARVARVDHVQLHLVEEQPYPEYRKRTHEFEELLSECLNVNPDVNPEQQRPGSFAQDQAAEEQQDENKPMPDIVELGTDFYYVPVTYKGSK